MGATPPSDPPVVGVVDDPRYREHRGPDGHPERPDRLGAVGQALDARRAGLARVEPRPATAEEILRVHSRDHLERVEAAARQAPFHLDPDTFVSPRSYEVALLAAGGTIDLVREIADGRLRSGIAAIRPPGHHAESDRAMGFCLFNNVAIAARALQAEAGVEKVLIFDWDVHHGNGTQHFFEEDPSVLYVSTHQYPYYPGTGDAGESGRGRGEGATVNVPLPAGCGDAEYVGAVQRIVAPVARAFAPDVFLVSCGFDAHADDPLAAMQVTQKGFAVMAAVVRALADELCGGRLAFVLEGGYSLRGLREGTDAVLDAALAALPPAAPAAGPLERGSVLEAVVGRVAQIHGSRYRALGAG